MTTPINSTSVDLASEPDVLPLILPSTPAYLKAKKSIAITRAIIEQINTAIESARVKHETVFQRHDGIIEAMMKQRGALLADIAMGQNKQEELAALDLMIDRQGNEDAVSSTARANLGQTIAALKQKLAIEQEFLKQQESSKLMLAYLLIKEYGETLGIEYLEVGQKLELLFSRIQDIDYIAANFCPSGHSKHYKFGTRDNLVIPCLNMEFINGHGKMVDYVNQINARYLLSYTEEGEKRIAKEKAYLLAVLGIEI